MVFSSKIEIYGMFQVYIAEALGDNKKIIPPKTFGIGPI